jgi:hypothetical protein
MKRKPMKRIPTLSPRQNLIVAAAVHAVADEAMADKLAACDRWPCRPPAGP